MPTGQQYATNVPQTTLTGLINATATVMSVASSSGWPATPFTAILEIGTSLQEPVDVTNITGTTWTVVRAIDSTVGFTHQVGATVTHGDIGRDFREARSHIDASQAVHGLQGGSSVVGTLDIQTLTNKTFNGANLSGAIGGSGNIFVGTVGAGGTGGSANGFVFKYVNPLVGPPNAGAYNTGDITFDVAGNAWYNTAGGSPGTWVPLGGGRRLISAQVLGSSAASVTFSSIPGLYRDLELVISAKSDGTTAAGYDPATMQFNGVTTASYNWNSIFATQGGSPTAASATSATAMQCAEIWNAHFGSNGRGISTILIPNYADTNNGKIFTSSSSATDGGAAGIMQNYTGTLTASTSTAAITSIKILATGNFVADSSFFLYGIW